VKRTQGILQAPGSGPGQAIGVSVHPEVLTQLRENEGADVEGLNVHRRHYKTILTWLGWKGAPESQGHGMQEKMYQETREAPVVPLTTYRS
jgi:hypothetical protein